MALDQRKNIVRSVAWPDGPSTRRKKLEGCLHEPASSPFLTPASLGRLLPLVLSTTAGLYSHSQFQKDSGSWKSFAPGSCALHHQPGALHLAALAL